jgi:hypothetical protein
MLCLSFGCWAGLRRRQLIPMTVDRAASIAAPSLRRFRQPFTLTCATIDCFNLPHEIGT